MKDKSKRTDRDLLAGGWKIGEAISTLKHARDLLREAKADKAADYVARALKSAEGAHRHNMRLRVGRDIHPYASPQNLRAVGLIARGDV
jgi:hypothetical protein